MRKTGMRSNSKTGVRSGSKNGTRAATGAAKVSDMLENETRKMEEKLDLVKKMMELEKDKRSQIQGSNQGTMWRSATTKKGIKGYSNAVVTHHKKTQPNLPPTSKVSNVGGQQRKGSATGPRAAPRKAGGQTQASKNFVGALPNAPRQPQQQNSKQTNIVENLSQNVKTQNIGEQTEKVEAPQASAPTQAEELVELKEFLQAIKLDKYKDKFVENGVEDLETILELKEEHVEQMGIPLGHKLKIIKRIKDLRAQKGQGTDTQSREGTNSQQKAPPGQAQPAQQTAASQGAAKSSLKEGTYDEGQSHNQFLEALNAWRSAGPGAEDSKEQLAQVPSSASKKVRFNDKENQVNKIEDCKQQDGARLRMANPARAKKKEPSTKLSCWQCYKLFYLSDKTLPLQKDAKSFCSDYCDQKYQLAHSQQCMLQGCEKRFLKAVGACVHGKWFCCDEHAESDPQTKKMIDLMAKGLPEPIVEMDEGIDLISELELTQNRKERGSKPKN